VITITGPIEMINLIFIRKPAVLAKSGLSSTTLHERIHAKLMPAPIFMGGNVSAYLEHEVDAVLAARTICFTDEQIQQLVSNLTERRHNTANELLNSLKMEGKL
jgi:prophage regulatory protein